MWQKLGKSRNLDEWEMTPATVNAYYNPTGNEVRKSRSLVAFQDWNLLSDCIPCWCSATTLLFPRMVGGYCSGDDFPSQSFRPGYLSYGSFGMVAAHELTVGVPACLLHTTTHQ